MTTGQTIEAKITVDAKQATAEVEKFNGKLSAVETIAKKSGLNVGTLGEAMKSMQGKLAPVAAAVSGVASALGQTNGEAGKVVAAAGQVAAAFAAGGPFGAALAGGVYAVDALTQAWEKELKAQDAALKQQYASLDTAVERLNKAKGQLDAIISSSRPIEWRISAEEKQKLADVDKIITENRIALKKLEGKVDTDLHNETVRGLDLAIKKNEEERQAIIDTANAQRKAIADAKADRESEAFRAKMKADADAKAAAAKAVAEKAAADAKARSETESKRLQARIVEGMAREEKKKAEQDAIEAQRRSMSLISPFAGGGMLAGQAVGTRGIAGTQTEIQRMTVEAAKNAAMAEDWSLAWKKAGNDVAESFGGATGAINGAIGVAIQGTQQYLDDVITGQEHATERLTQLVMSQAGQALISSGTKLAGEAVVSAFTPGLQPLAVTQGAAAAGLIASGLALGGGATAVGHMAAGGTMGQALPDKTAKDRGASPRSSGGGGSGGPLVINVSYGVGGPLPEDTAREIAKVMRTGDRRRGAA